MHFYGCDDPAPEIGRLFPKSLETGAGEQATKPAVGCFCCLFLIVDFLIMKVVNYVKIN